MPRPEPPQSQVRLSWLLGALGLLGAAAIVCAYLALCLLFYQGQWQLLYHPSALGRQTPADAGLAFTPVQFGASEGGTPQLTGWWVPSAMPAATVPEMTLGRAILFLHDGAGSLSDTVPTLAQMHAAGLAVLAVDYRGFGASAPVHPSEASMVEDAQAARSYLLEARHIPASSLAVWGQGSGATIAAEAFCGSGPAMPLILENPNPPARATLRADPRARLLPLGLLQRDRLDASAALAACRAPKLFLRSGTDAAIADDADRLYQAAAPPKQSAAGQALRGEVAEVAEFLAHSGERP